MLYSMLKTGSSRQPDTVRPTLPKTAREIQKERKTLIQSMFAAKQAGCVAKVVNRSLIIDNNVFHISNIPVEYQVASTKFCCPIEDIHTTGKLCWVSDYLIELSIQISFLFMLLPLQGFWPQRAKNPRRHLRTLRVIEEDWIRENV